MRFAILASIAQDSPTLDHLRVPSEDSYSPWWQILERFKVTLREKELAMPASTFRTIRYVVGLPQSWRRESKW